MMRDPRRLLAASMVIGTILLALLPATALACPIAIRKVGPIKESRAHLVKPTFRVTSRESWGIDASWRSTEPRLSQFVIIRRTKDSRLRSFHGFTFREQQSLSIDARGPEDNGWMYFDDDDPNTPPCQLTGKIKYQAPKIRVIQGRKEVRVAAISQETVGDRTGCILGPDNGVRFCPNLTRVIVRLAKPLGTRKLVFETFA